MELLLGHLCGDYLFQTNWMGTNKKENTPLGWLACFVHCCIYTTTVCLFTGVWAKEFVLLVFLNHFVIDKFGFVEWYLHTVKGLSIKDCIEDVKKTSKYFVPTYIRSQNKLSTSESPYFDAYAVLKLALSLFIYIVVDNTMHLTITFYGSKFLGIL